MIRRHLHHDAPVFQKRREIILRVSITRNTSL